MTTNNPLAELFSFQLHGQGQGRLTVRCPHCNTLHSHRWHGRHVAFDASAPCSVELMYRVDLSAALAMHTADRATRDDNAMSDVPHLWEE